MSFRDMTVECFLEELASKSPAPGGGSASAIAAAMGAGLVSMVVALPKRARCQRMIAPESSRRG